MIQTKFARSRFSNHQNRRAQMIAQQSIIRLTVHLTVFFSLAFNVAVAQRNEIAERFQQLDTDKDKSLTIDEYLVGSTSPERSKRDFLVFDINGNQQLSLAEFSAIPSDLNAQGRGEIEDPYDDLLTAAIDSAEQIIADWKNDQVPSNELTRVITELEYLYGDQRYSYSQAFENQLRRLNNRNSLFVSRLTAKEFISEQFGITYYGHDLRFSDGRLAPISRFLRADQNVDQKLSRDEFLIAWQDAGASALFDQADADHDGELTLSELTDPNWSGHDDPILRFLAADTDLNGFLNLEELLQSEPKEFSALANMTWKAFDSDKDNQWTLSEYRLSLFGNRGLDARQQFTDSNRSWSLEKYEFQPLNHAEFSLIFNYYFYRIDQDESGRLESNELEFHRLPSDAFYTINLDGSGLRKVYQSDEYSGAGSPCVSADGKKVIFDRHRGNETYNQYRAAYFLLDGEEEGDLSHGLMPTWSPDGQYYSCSRYKNETGEYGTCIMNADGTLHQHLSTDTWGAQWSPDGQSIACIKGGDSIAVYDVASEEFKTVMDAKTHKLDSLWYNMCWSPDSKMLAGRVTQVNGGDAIAIINMTDSAPRVRLIKPAASFDNDMAWTPDGQHLIFSMHHERLNRTRLFRLPIEGDAQAVEIPGIPEELSLNAVCTRPNGEGIVFRGVAIP
ncbi:hypothetical protein SH668x_003795 [Planctomicrobium sp. SH668]|uniref:hypothetical protein n=1 Tax=Planctomicrobium sp. SH668 TaxID=3448126 RepID=UPI003F5B1949